MGESYLSEGFPSSTLVIHGEHYLYCFTATPKWRRDCRSEWSLLGRQRRGGEFKDPLGVGEQALLSIGVTDQRLVG
jgi:hypothetical protein